MQATTDAPQAPRRRLRRRLVPSLALLAVLATAGCATTGDSGTAQTLRLGFPDPITDRGRQILDLWVGSWIAAAVVGAGVYALILIAVVRYRKKSDLLPRQVRYNLPIEVLYTVVPVVIVAVLFYYTAIIEEDVNELDRPPDVTVGVVGFQWNWQFTYVAEQESETVQVTGRPGEPATLVLPTDRVVRFIETSPDVIHSFWVPAFLFKRDVVPGRTNQFQVVIDRDAEGSYIGRCAELCGADHDRMNFEVRVVSPEAYDQYLQNARGTGGQPGGSATAAAAVGSVPGA